MVHSAFLCILFGYNNIITFFKVLINIIFFPKHFPHRCFGLKVESCEHLFDKNHHISTEMLRFTCFPTEFVHPAKSSKQKSRSCYTSLAPVRKTIRKDIHLITPNLKQGGYRTLHPRLIEKVQVCRLRFFLNLSPLSLSFSSGMIRL